ncbi:MAG: ABC transporter ATP-binding protein [Intrasporangium sp.]|uniref:ABC transporter ATP-binding protein n=1 Tax=Intrasporangium sp. TaxID=1925024 RepID=UPI0026494C1A|nr:ABC transporter ATP-binding protein [Intrasporangium sp.]MDN5796769.1 ABC transporter ATP-binding protein [Intrasporangium sp.]
MAQPPPAPTGSNLESLPGGADVELAHVSRIYQVGDGTTLTAVDDISGIFAAGSVNAITGASGSGKSTLLHLIGAIDRPDSGTVVVDGTDLAGLGRRALADYRRSIGFVFQRFNLLPTLTVLANVIAPVIPYRTGYDKKRRALDLLEQVGLGQRARDLPSHLSGGQQQRVAIARALVNEPRLILADEPTGNLDTATGREIVDLLLSLRDGFGVTIVLATHDLLITERCDRSMRLQDGHCVDDATP